MKHFLFLLFLFTACTPVEKFDLTPTNTSSVIYEDDSRQDITDSQLSAAAQATVMIFNKNQWSAVNKGSLWGRLKTRSLKDSYPLCADEQFQDQPLLGECSGVLVAPNKILTAAHCFKGKNACAEAAFIFAWNAEKAVRPEVSAEEIYTCKKIIAQEFHRAKGIDYAVIELDRPAAHIQPVALAPSSPIKEGTLLTSYSYPLGLPLKRDVGPLLNNDPQLSVYSVAVDTFNGSSGSPLFNDKGELVGILSSGKDDFNEDDIYRVQTEGGCINFQRCKNSECFGEKFFKVEALASKQLW